MNSGILPVNLLSEAHLKIVENQFYHTSSTFLIYYHEVKWISKILHCRQILKPCHCEWNWTTDSTTIHVTARKYYFKLLSPVVT
jgi:hypothetical protein